MELSGMRGYTGIVLQSQLQVKYLLVYLLMYATMTIMRLLRLDVICDEFKDVKMKKEFKCADLQMVYLTIVAMEFFT